MKKNLIFAVLILAAHFATPASFKEFFLETQYEEYILENGMQLFVAEDFSNALVRIELAVKAGISAQSANTAGFFPLYTKLFSKTEQNPRILNSLNAECAADAARYSIKVSPDFTEQTLNSLSKCAFAPDFSDSVLQKEFSALKTEVMQYAPTAEAFINSSIDSRVFSEAPWKQDSGIYPELFNKTSTAKARAILTGISKEYYTPQNSALFISGCITKEEALNLVKKTFGTYKKTSQQKIEQPAPAGNKQKKFVLHDRQFSKDLTQTVIQYTSLQMNQADIMAAAYNANDSTIKQTLCKKSLLNIRDEEYIHAAAAHKNGSSRLIFQSLLEASKASPVEQSESFLSIIKQAAFLTDEVEYEKAKKRIAESFSELTAQTDNFMQALCDFWIIENASEKSTINVSQNAAERLFNRTTQIFTENTNTFEATLNSEEPFIFVLVNSRVYSKYAKEFRNAGYEEINSKNGSWYTQNLFKNALNEVRTPSKKDDETEPFKSAKDFIARNKNQISSYTLKNGIPVTVKENPGTSNVVLLIQILGGKIADGGNSGFEAVMTNAFASNIQKMLDSYQAAGILESPCEVLAETLRTQSLISIECSAEDFAPCVKAVSDALIFGEIEPAEADHYVYAVQTQKRLTNASAVNQLTFRAMRQLYKSPDILDIFDSEKDILQQTTYLDILAAYPRLLNAKLYKLTVCGNIQAEYAHKVLEEKLGILSAKEIKNQITIPKPSFTEKTKRLSVKVRHLFYTDVKAEDAGPMPAVLVPTKTFYDPTQFYYAPPVANTTDSLIFESLLFYIKERLEEQNFKIRLMIPEEHFPVAAVTFVETEQFSVVESAINSTIEQLLQELKDPETANKTTSLIQDSWIRNQLSETSSNRNTARLMAILAKPNQYLTEYEELLALTATNFADCVEQYLLPEPVLKVVSTYTKQ